MSSSIGYQLGVGSGLDIATMVKGLADAQRAPRQALLDRRSAANEAKISSLAELSNAIDSFSSAVSSLVAGGTLSSQPNSSDSSILGVTRQSGARLGGLSAQLEVVQLAKAQVLESVTLASADTAVGPGTMTLNTAKGSFQVVIDSSNNSLAGLAAGINAADAGVTASVVTDTNGSRLVLKGGVGADQAFTISATGTNNGLRRFRYPPGTTGMTAVQTAQDAIVRQDGVSITRASNSFSDLIPGVTIDLKKAAPGTIVSVAATRPSAAIEAAVQDFTAAYNEVMSILSTAGANGVGGAGPLRGDVGLSEMRRQMAQLPSVKLTSSGAGPHTLAELGVRTNRDGTLGVDAAKLKAALTDHPDAVEAMFNPGQFASDPAVTIKSALGRVKPGVYTLTDLVPAAGEGAASGRIDGITMTGVGGNLIAPSASAAVGLIVGVNAAAASVTITIEPGLGGALQAIRDELRARSGPFATTKERLDGEAQAIAKELGALEVKSEKYYNQLLGTFTSMERQVSSFKATQSYLDQQIKIWTGGND